VFNSKFLAVNNEAPALNQIWDGIVGIAPYSSKLEYKEQNFMYGLKNSGLIDHNVASFYIKAT